MKKLVAVVLIITLFMTGCTGNSQEPGSASISSAVVSSVASENESLQSEGRSKINNKSSSDEEILEQSRSLWKDEFEIMDEYDIDEYQKLATILMARYLDMQVRIDVEGIESLNPVLKDALKDEDTRSEFIYDLLQCSEFQLQAIEEADLKNGTLTM